MELEIQDDNVKSNYKKLIEYACSNNDTVMFKVVRYNSGKKRVKKIYKYYASY